MRKELTISELDAEFMELVPARETLSFGNTNWAAVYASNSSLALNAASVNASAVSTATQNIQVIQG
ncbi:hypothetical protein [Nocardioides sp.]|jgi:hypothetical protein|uniref:hypothetical protein n=1 Tax=Nocardioides sp. TaxID=35761 RepID=UPI002F402D79